MSLFQYPSQLFDDFGGNWIDFLLPGRARDSVERLVDFHVRFTARDNEQGVAGLLAAFEIAFRVVWDMEIPVF